MSDYARLAFWVLACLFLVPFCAVAWIVLFWVNPDDHESDEDDGFCFDEEEATLPWPNSHKGFDA